MDGNNKFPPVEGRSDILDMEEVDPIQPGLQAQPGNTSQSLFCAYGSKMNVSSVSELAVIGKSRIHNVKEILVVSIGGQKGFDQVSDISAIPAPRLFSRVKINPNLH